MNRPRIYHNEFPVADRLWATAQHFDFKKRDCCIR